MEGWLRARRARKILQERHLLQIVPGIAVPIGVGPSRGEKGIFLCLSFEHPFGKRKNPGAP